MIKVHGVMLGLDYLKVQSVFLPSGLGKAYALAFAERGASVIGKC